MIKQSGNSPVLHYEPDSRPTFGRVLIEMFDCAVEVMAFTFFWATGSLIALTLCAIVATLAFQLFQWIR